MRILVTTWSSRLVGGTETYLARIMARLAAAGHDIGFCYELDAPADRAPLALPAGAPAFGVAAAGLEATLRAVKDWRPDVIYAHGVIDPDLEARLLTVAPAVFFAHGYYGTCISGEKTHKFPVMQPCGRLFGPPCLALYFPRRCGGLSPATMIREYRRQQRRRSLLRRYAAVLAPSEHMRHELARHGAAGGRVITCAHSTPGTGRHQLADQRRAFRSPADPWHLSFVGRMDRLKGGQALIAALPATRAAAGRPLKVTFAGDGPARADWMRDARRIASEASGIAIEFTGWLPREGVDALLETADVLVMPSQWPEPHGLAGPEANSHGVPVVAFATGGIPEWLVDGVNGCLAPGDPPTAQGLGEALVRCLRSLESSDALRRGALEAANARPEEAHLSALLDVLHGAAAGADRIGA